MSIIYSDKTFKFLDDVFREYFYISSLEIKSEVILLEALFDMVVKGYCYHILKINQVFDDKKYYSKPKNKRKCIEKFISTLNIMEKNIDQEIKSIRNSITHGDYQIQIDDLHKAKFYYRTLINESILKLLGYTGEFMNYYQQYELEKYKERLFECLSAKKYDEDEYEELQEIKYGLIPKLYRYMPANEENIKQYLIDYKIKLSTPNYYDDTRDTSFYVNKNDLEEYVDNVIKYSNGNYRYSINSETCKQISIPTNEIEIKSPLLEKHENKKEIYEQINNVGQKSFTATKNSRYHWDEYAGENGICIEYDFKKLDFNTYIVHNIFPVIYMDESKFDIMKDYAGNWLNLYFISLIKNSGYINDNEWRLIQIIDDLYEYKDEIRLPKPECIYLSKNIDDNIKEYITKLCEERNINIEI